MKWDLNLSAFFLHLWPWLEIWCVCWEILEWQSEVVGETGGKRHHRLLPCHQRTRMQAHELQQLGDAWAAGVWLRLPPTTTTVTNSSVRISRGLGKLRMISYIIVTLFKSHDRILVNLSYFLTLLIYLHIKYFYIAQSSPDWHLAFHCEPS